jgi:nitrogen fixation protein NifU and related proteins
MADLEDLYREIILDHYRNPRNKGELATPPAHKSDGVNPTCGDEISVYLQVDGRGDSAIVTDIKIGGVGCSISQSSASMMSSTVKGKTLAEARVLIASFKHMLGIEDTSGIGTDVLESAKLGDLAALRGVMKFPVRIKCATLSWNTLAEGIEEVAKA